MGDDRGFNILVLITFAIALVTLATPEWAINGVKCPHCDDELEWDWHWQSDIDNSIQGDENDYQSWYLVCECGSAFILDDDNELIEWE